MLSDPRNCYFWFQSLTSYTNIVAKMFSVWNKKEIANESLILQVVAADIFAAKFQEDLLNQYAGLQFRNKVIV